MIHLKDGWAIDADTMQYTLGKCTSVTKDGKTTVQMTNTSYHATVEQALTSFLRRVQREQIKSHDYTLEQACTAFSKAQNEIMELAGDIEVIESRAVK